MGFVRKKLWKLFQRLRYKTLGLRKYACLCLILSFVILSVGYYVNGTEMVYGATGTYTVVFDGNGGSGSMPNQTFSRSEFNVIPDGEPYFTKKYYAFAGWEFYSPVLGETLVRYAGDEVRNIAYDGDTVTFVAQWEGSELEINYHINGGAIDSDKYNLVNNIVSYNNDYVSNTYRYPFSEIDLKDIEELGLYRIGYHIDSGKEWLIGSTSGNSMSEEKTTDVSWFWDYIDGYGYRRLFMYANWQKNTYTIQYDKNGGSGSMSSTSATYDTSVSLKSNAFTKTGYTFNGWNTKADGSGISYSNGQSVKNLTATDGGSVTLYAQWKPNTYTVSYNGNGNTGGGMSDSTHTYDESQTLNANQFTRTGYTFIGWSTTDGVTTDTGKDVTISYKPEESVKNLASEQGKVVNLYAIWQRNQYTVTYNANGGTFGGNSTTQSVYYGDSVDLSPSCTKDGYIFLGWATAADDTICLSSHAMPAKNITLYALYSIPVSDIKEAHVISYNTGNLDKYNLFELEEQSETINGYIYSIDEINLLDGLNWDSLEVWLLLYDHAGNRSQIPIETPMSPEDQEPGDIPVPNIYLQTVEHYLWNMQTESYQYYMSISELVYEGDTYTPEYISEGSEDYPIGYKPESIDGSYVVSGVTTTKAYYKPVPYTLYFDPNGGECDTDSKSIYTGSMYGELPTPSRNGHDFMGWHTDKKYGIKVTATDIYTDVGDSTLYAIWTAHKHNVVYDYKTNGGTYTTLETDSVEYGDSIDMTVEAFKDGWEFVGWNTNPDATVGLEHLTMGEEDILLYAIYKKDITASFIDIKDGEVTKRETTLTIHNRETQCPMPVPEQNSTDGWECLGWSFGTDADAAIDTSSGSILKLTDDATLYGCYIQKITISYDTNGSPEEIQPQTGERYLNASGSYKNPLFVLANAPNLEKHSFVEWKESGSYTTYHPGDSIEFEADTTLTAEWDRFPEIEAYDRYFTLEQAQNGEITPETLLEKVIASDREDGVLENGIDVTIKDYDASTFTGITEDHEIEITYIATDSFGNSVTKTVTVHVVDTTVGISPLVRYVRFISEDFYIDEEELLPAEKGGVENTSVWRTDETYRRLLEAVVLNEKQNETWKNVSFFEASADIPVAGSGEWEKEEETWVFTYEDVQEMKEFTNSYGFGNISTENGLELFTEWFGGCKKN